MLCRAAREILVPCPGIKPGPRRWKHQLSLNPGTTRDALNNFRFTEKLSYRAESSCTLLHSPPQVPLLPAFAVVWDSRYKWHTITDTLLEFTLFVLCILWVLINVWRCVSTVTTSHRTVSLPGNASVLCLFIPPSLWLQAATGLPAVSVVLPLWERHLVGIIQSEVFSYWLLSLSNTHVRLLHVFSWCDSSFLFFLWIIVSCMDVQPFIHSSRTSWLLSCLGNYK